MVSTVALFENLVSAPSVDISGLQTGTGVRRRLQEQWKDACRILAQAEREPTVKDVVYLAK